MITTDIFNSKGEYLRTATAPEGMDQHVDGEIAVTRTTEVTGPIYLDLATGNVMSAGNPPDRFNYRFDIATRTWTDTRTPEQIHQLLTVKYEAAVQDWLDATASSWQYESILSAASYVASTVPKFKTEATLLIAWRDQVWNACYAALAQVEEGTIPMPASPEAFIATLPQPPARP